MDFAAKLNSPFVREQAEAAMFLRSQGADGVVYLPLLLQRCQAIEPTKELDRFEQTLLCLGANTLGELLAESGFNAADPLHNAILCWIIESTKSPNINVAGHAVYALGNLGRQSTVAQQSLCSIVRSELRGDEHKAVSLRAVALRLVRRIDSDLAASFVDAPAFNEYAQAIEYWTASETSKNIQAKLELQYEAEWIRKLKK